MGKVSNYMCLGCWTVAPIRVVRADGQVITLSKPSTAGALLDKLHARGQYYICEASTPGMNSPLFPRTPLSQLSDNPLFAPASPVQGGAMLPCDSKLQSGHLYFVLPFPDLSPKSLHQFRSGAYPPNSLSSLLMKSCAEEDPRSGALPRLRRIPGSRSLSCDQGAAKSTVRRISTKVSPEPGNLDAAGRPSPEKDEGYRWLSEEVVSDAPREDAVSHVMKPWRERGMSPQGIMRRRRRSLRTTYSGSWKPELPIISEDGTLASCLCNPLSDNDDDSVTMLPVMKSAAFSPSRLSAAVRIRIRIACDAM